ncbi:hypothetical protein [Cucumibacter marinus]|nr:hypothetical protein [Cucumibacter marinus]
MKFGFAALGVIVAVIIAGISIDFAADTGPAGANDPTAVSSHVTD